MTATVSFNPVLTTNASGSFNKESVGYIQGTALDDPAIRFALSGGVVSDDETDPMWGGIAINETTTPSPVSTPPGPAGVLGGEITRATNLTAGASGQVTGFTVFDQAHSMVTTPQSPVPLAGSAMSVNFYRLGSGARIAVKCDPNLTALEGESISTKVSWDFENQMLIPYASATVDSGTYTSGTGAVSLTTATAHGLEPGDTFIPALTGSGTFANLNVEQVATTGTTGTTLNFTAATGQTLTISGGTIGTGGALPVQVLDVQIGNSMTVDYDSGTGFATWDRSGNAAIILI